MISVPKIPVLYSTKYDGTEKELLSTALGIVHFHHCVFGEEETV